MISRRGLLAGAAGLAACGPKLAKPFNGYAFVANRGSKTLAAVNLSHFRTDRQIPLEAAPEAVIAQPQGTAALVLLPETGILVEVRADSLHVSRGMKVAGRASGMRMAGETLWILASEPEQLVAIDLKAWQIVRRIPLAYAAQDFDIAADGRTAVLSYPGKRRCGLVDLKQSAAVVEVELAADANVVRFRPDSKQVLLGSAIAQTVTVADRATGKVLVTMPLPFGPERFCFSLDNGGQMFATGKGMDSVAIVYPYQTEVAETMLAGREPGAMTVNESLLFVTNPPTGDATVIEIAERRVIARIESGQEPCAIALTPDGEYALVLNRKSGDMAVVRLSKLTDLRYKRAPLFTVIAVGEEPVAMAVVRL